MKTKRISLWLVALFYFGLLVLLRWQLDWGALWLLMGGLLGLGFVMVDRFIYVYLTKPHEQLSEHVRLLVQQRRWMDAVRLLRNRGNEQRELTVRSVFFMAAWIPAAFFVTTSTGSMLGTGLVMGIGLHLLYDVAMGWQDFERMKGWLFWPVRRQVSDVEAQVVIGLFGFFFVLLSLLLV